MSLYLQGLLKRSEDLKQRLANLTAAIEREQAKQARSIEEEDE